MELSGKIVRLAATGLVALSVAGCHAGGPAGPAPRSDVRATTPGPATTVAPAQLETDFERVIKKVLPAIVQITTTQALGSGIVYDTGGHILTNAHVVGTSREFQVTLATGGRPRKAHLVNTFPAGDLAVIRVDDARGLTPAVFGRSADLQVGQLVLAMGNPLGFSGSVTEGIVSALGRTVSGESHGGSAPAIITNAIQTSAPINPGNSGGALVDLSGNVIGIPTLAAVDPDLGAAPGIGFAIPSDTATDVARQIIRFGRVVNSHRAALGVRVGTAVDSSGNPIGVVVGAVTPEGGAAKAGIRPGDVIVKVNGTPTPSSNALSQLLATLKPGDRVQIDLQHPDGRRSTAIVTLSELPPTG
ncbi:trypsin-like peptidase domain-containing protein [Microbispora sp. RL4-1S]|uniref:Trypsin-like peptidase domain-containing protein n=1 Tax=Microbispora oryzae TaxID=2806554 RepID=A0A940WRZ4_9ACTN|nr:trypsin-like peptidase domain-containing protein [Microbispora oryzae]MBP2705939.1 trypsin-like peptidase domain-containing protein [Microbispora oryzae]